MNSLFTGLRNIIWHRGSSVTRTVAMTFVPKRDIHSDQIIFKNPQYVKKPEVREEACKAIVDYAAVSGLDAAGAVSAEIELVPLCYTLCFLQSDQPFLAEVSTLAKPVPTSFGV